MEKVKTFKEDNRQSILEKFQHLMAEKDAAFVKVCMRNTTVMEQFNM